MSTIVQMHTKNFETLRRAFAAGDVALIEVQAVKGGEVYACIATCTQDGAQIVFTPFALFLNGNPYEMLRAPDPYNGGKFLPADNEEGH